jgi:DNA invertase Pin-like site-specific DNA recombinase
VTGQLPIAVGICSQAIIVASTNFPQANRLTVHILAAVTEDEASMISTRIEVALQAARARGVRLLGTRHRDRIASQAKCGAKANALVRAAKAQQGRADVLPVIEASRASGAHTLRAVVAHLHYCGIPGPRSGAWHANSVRRVVKSATAALSHG